jgi:hypothetical protein
VLGPPFTPNPLFQWYLQSKGIVINLSMKCWYWAFNAQGSRLIIVVVQLRGVKTCVSAVEALRKKERQDEIQFTTKIDGFLSFIPRWMLMYCFAGFSEWPNSGFWCCVFLTLRITLIYSPTCYDQRFFPNKTNWQITGNFVFKSWSLTTLADILETFTKILISKNCLNIL